MPIAGQVSLFDDAVDQPDGAPPPGHETEALRHYRREGTPLRGERVDLARARWRPPDAGPDAVPDRD